MLCSRLLDNPEVIYKILLYAMELNIRSHCYRQLGRERARP